MVYQRPQRETRLSPEEKKQLLQEYLGFYKDQAQLDIQNLNKKIPREAFESFLDEIGCMLLNESATIAKNNPVVKNFLADTPLPPPLQDLLPDDFRVFCLMLNALKQWISAEQQATDRYLLGGTARDTLRSLTNHCLVTGDEIGEQGELHHPVRDGRPPIILSKEGHAAIEGQTRRSEDTDDSTRRSEGRKQLSEILVGDPSDVIKRIKKDGHHSWVQLRNACKENLGEKVTHTTPNVRNTSQSFARKVRESTGMSYREILGWLDNNE